MMSCHFCEQTHRHNNNRKPHAHNSIKHLYRVSPSLTFLFVHRLGMFVSQGVARASFVCMRWQRDENVRGLLKFYDWHMPDHGLKDSACACVLVGVNRPLAIASPSRTSSWSPPLRRWRNGAPTLHTKTANGQQPCQSYQQTHTQRSRPRKDRPSSFTESISKHLRSRPSQSLHARSLESQNKGLLGLRWRNTD